MRTLAYFAAARRSGKTVAMQKQLATYLKRHPNAVIATVKDGETRIEKPVYEVPQRQLPK